MSSRHARPYTFVDVTTSTSRLLFIFFRWGEERGWTFTRRKLRKLGAIVAKGVLTRQCSVVMLVQIHVRLAFATKSREFLLRRHHFCTQREYVHLILTMRRSFYWERSIYTNIRNDFTVFVFSFCRSFLLLHVYFFKHVKRSRSKEIITRVILFLCSFFCWVRLILTPCFASAFRDGTLDKYLK